MRPPHVTAIEDHGGDTGFSLLELMVAMTVFTIIMIMVFATIGWVINAEGQVESVSQSSSQADEAFMTIDGEVRYAADINQPGEFANNYFVEFESDWTTATLGAPDCTQLEYNSSLKTLQQRSWLSTGSVPASTANDWQVLASNVTATGDPFSLTLSVPSYVSAPTTTSTVPLTTTTTTSAAQTEIGTTPYQLTVSLTASTGYGPTLGTSQLSFTVSALDVSSTSTDQGVCGGTPTS